MVLLQEKYTTSTHGHLIKKMWGKCYCFVFYLLWCSVYARKGIMLTHPLRGAWVNIFTGNSYDSILTTNCPVITTFIIGTHPGVMLPCKCTFPADHIYSTIVYNK